VVRVFRGDVYSEFEPLLSIMANFPEGVVVIACLQGGGGEGGQTRVCWQQFELG